MHFFYTLSPNYDQRTYYWINDWINNIWTNNLIRRTTKEDRQYINDISRTTKRFGNVEQIGDTTIDEKENKAYAFTNYVTNIGLNMPNEIK